MNPHKKVLQKIIAIPGKQRNNTDSDSHFIEK